MEISWKILCLCIELLLCKLCNGLPINLENTAADYHTQLLTGLVAVLLTICSVVFLVGCLCCQRRNGFKDEQKEFRDSPVVASTASNLDHGHINPVANGEFTIFTPLSPPHQNNNIFLANQQIITRTQEDYCYGEVDVSSWFNGSEVDFPRTKLKYIREIGKGWFGRVVEGAAQDISHDQKWTPVVVRILEATATSKERVVFLHDAAIYKCGSHPNVLGLIGRCLETIPLLILQEFCPQGDLKSYLLKNKSTADKFLSTEYPLLWCCQLTSALKHLHDNKLVHPDLATRNCQLTTNLTLKLGDYGLAVFQYPEDYYQGAPGVPVRWCAPESISYTSTTIQSNKLTMEANIWSLAVTMWEICECGSQPYSNLTDDEVISQVLGSKKVRLDRPQYKVLYTDYMFRLMQLCWTNSESRPAIYQIDLMLTDLLQVYQNTKSSTTPLVESPGVSVEDFDKRWESLKPNTIVKTDNHMETVIVDIDHETVTKTLSPSLNNLHGSLDNLLVDSESQMESWLENVATKTGDMSYVQGLSDAMKDLDNTIALENASSGNSSPGQQNLNTIPKIEFKLGPTTHTFNDKNSDISVPHDSLNDSMSFVRRTSSGSDTEEENWKTKIERGAYSEKVRQKSRSVADLMVLTHIDQSESDTETPLPSLDYFNKTNYKNVRYAPKNFENVSLKFGSEGNLLSVEDTFQNELKKLKEERKDSLPFVPENSSQNNSVRDNVATTDYLEESPSKRLLQELNSTSEIKPANQVYNVFNVTIDKYSPLHLPTTKLEEIINFKENVVVPMVEEFVQNNIDLDDKIDDENDVLVIHVEEDDQRNDEKNVYVEVLPKDKDFSDNLDELTILENHVNEEDAKINSDTTSDLNKENDVSPITDITNEPLHSKIEQNVDSITKLPDIIESSLLQHRIDEGEEEISAQNLPKEQSVMATETKVYNVPKLVDLIQDNDALMDYIIEKYENETLKNDEEIPEENAIKSSAETSDDVLEIKPIENVIGKTTDFINNELKNYDDFRLPLEPKFDLTKGKEQIIPNHLTHSLTFYNSPLGKSLQDFSTKLSSQDTFLSLNLFCDVEKQIEQEIGNQQADIQDNNLGLYSLETWDNFLGRALDDQSEKTQENFFDSFTSEPQSLLILDNNDLNVDDDNDEKDENSENDQMNVTYTIDDSSLTDINKAHLEEVENSENTQEVNNGTWDNAGGWFLHPQINSEDVTGEMTICPETDTDSYVKYNMDDEIMAAIRTELLNKLPQAQGTTSGPVEDDEEWESTEPNEVFLRYNVYNTPLSPIPEESLMEDNSGESTPKQEQNDNDDSDWSEPEQENLPHDNESQSAQTQESPTRGHLHRHTPSQDSCCSNDTLFNLEELTCIGNDTVTERNHSPTPKVQQQKDESQSNEQQSQSKLDDSMTHNNKGNESNILDGKQLLVESVNKSEVESNCQLIEEEINNKNNCDSEEEKNVTETITTDKQYIEEFLLNERGVCVQITEPLEESSDSNTENNLPFIVQNQIAPLPSPEDKPWKQLAQSLLTNNKMLPTSESNETEEKSEDRLYVNINDDKTDSNVYENINSQHCHLNYNNEMSMTNMNDIYNEADYVNIVNLENTKNSAEFSTNNKKNNVIDDDDDDDVDNDNSRNESPDYVNTYNTKDTLIINDEDGDEHDTFAVLTDIRFNGPADSQMMTTSFSESNDLNDEQDWDSGSDTRSSSSGEFIWKEGEHEESLKALRAAPQDSLDDIQPMEEIQEETSSDSSGSDEEGDSPEFVPSAWDKYATPTKSALRSPEKTLEKAEKKKTKGVWFKKQKYHCVYEYPREPDSPVLHSYDLWKPQDYHPYEDWDLEVCDNFPLSSEKSIFVETNQPHRDLNLYQLSSVPDFLSSGVDDEFYISSSTKPFDRLGDLSSQFFPGNWMNSARFDNITPDSGVEDVTPGSVSDNTFITSKSKPIVVPTLKSLASDAVNKSKKIEELKGNDVLGGLRHTRSRLKLDLPPSPSAFTTNNKMFNIEPNLDPLITREKPTFTTFGKSRFLVQHVDTPPDENTKQKNVSFEALPYKPLSQEQLEGLEENENFLRNEKNRGKIEVVRGEASLLDSADEDSGIESSTLERKLSSTEITN